MLTELPCVRQQEADYKSAHTFIFKTPAFLQASALNLMMWHGHGKLLKSEPIHTEMSSNAKENNKK